MGFRIFISARNISFNNKQSTLILATPNCLFAFIASVLCDICNILHQKLWRSSVKQTYKKKHFLRKGKKGIIQGFRNSTTHSFVLSHPISIIFYRIGFDVKIDFVNYIFQLHLNIKIKDFLF